MGQRNYRAIQVSRPGVFELVERAVQEPAPGQVRIRVEACGVCHTDRWTVDGDIVPIEYPRVPGHEVVGRIDAVGDGVDGWTIGQRVGVGFLAGPCGKCPACRRGDFTRCVNQAWTGIHHDGGYAEMMMASANGLVTIPDGLDSAEAAPLLCAGITVFKALKKSHAEPGDTVAIHGIGGLGHLAVQFARKMGFRTVAISRGAEKEDAAKALGAHYYIDSDARDAAAMLRELGGANAIVSTIPSPKLMSTLIAGLAPHGQLFVVGLAAEMIEVSPIALVKDDVSIHGSLTGTAIESEDALAFSALENIRTKIETVPLQSARAAYDKMMKNQAHFRMVLSTQAS